MMLQHDIPLTSHTSIVMSMAGLVMLVHHLVIDALLENKVLLFGGQSESRALLENSLTQDIFRVFLLYMYKTLRLPGHYVLAILIAWQPRSIYNYEMSDQNPKCPTTFGHARTYCPDTWNS